MPAAIDERTPPPWVRRAILGWWAVLVALWFTRYLATQLEGLLIQFVIALFLSFALEPLVDKLERNGVRRGVATALSLLVLFALVLSFLAAMGTLIASQLNDLIDDLPGYLERAQGWLDDRFGIEVDADSLNQQLEPGGQASEFATDLAGNLVSVGSTVANLLFQALTITILTYYFTADGPRLRRQICSLLPPERQRRVLSIWELAITKTGAYISSRLLLAICSGLFHWVVFRILGLPSAVALALWVGVISQFIPTLGTYLAGLLPIIVALGVQPSKALWVVAAVVVYQQIENYVLQPRITAQTLDLHPAVAIAAVLAGTSLFGATGALLALPFVATAGGFVTAYIERHDVIDDRLTTDRRTSRTKPDLTERPEDPEPAEATGLAGDTGPQEDTGNETG